MKNLLQIGLTFFLILPKICIANLSNNKEIAHEIKLIHPGISTTNAVSKNLIEIQNENAQIVEFYMDVETVVCGDRHCRIDTIRIFWNNLGFFKRLKLPPNVQLEKADGEQFIQADYQKLNQILSNKNSGLKDVYKWDIVGTEASEGVDAISRATISLNTVDYVKGSVWTCYTLWHWVNGEIFSIIRRISGSNFDEEKFTSILNHGEVNYRKFALEELNNRQNYHPKILQLVLNQADSEDDELQKLIISYLEKGTNDIYQSSMEVLLKSGNNKYQLFYLNSLYNMKKTLSLSFYESTIQSVFSSNNYLIINQYLNIMDEKKALNSSLISQILPSLYNENFIIARRIYWFLNEKPLSKLQRIKLNQFQKKNKDRL